MKPVSTGTEQLSVSTSTVLQCPPMRWSRSKTVTSWALLNSHAAESPEIPVPTTAIFKRSGRAPSIETPRHLEGCGLGTHTEEIAGWIIDHPRVIQRGA